MLGYAGNILRINLTNQTYSVEPTPKELMRGFIGGRGFNMWRLYYETPQQAGPLHEDNNLYIGVLYIELATWLMRFSLSPLGEQHISLFARCSSRASPYPSPGK